MGPYRINQWCVYPSRCELVRVESGETQQLEPQLMSLLSLLVSHQNDVVSRERLADEVWPEQVIEDNTISRAVTRLRKALDDDYRDPIYIKTVPKRGYRLVAKVEDIREEHPEEACEQNELKATSKSPMLIAVFLSSLI